MTTFRRMSIVEESTYSHLHDLLFDAGDKAPHELDGVDARRGAFETLVTRLHLVLNGERALYATHSFTDSNFSVLHLEGRVTVLTGSVVATALVEPGSAIDVTLVALNSLTSISIHGDGEHQLRGQSAWNRLNIRLSFDGLQNALLIPGRRSSESNTRDFEAIYPLLMASMRGQQHGGRTAG
jgi:hypothetical protein